MYWSLDAGNGVGLGTAAAAEAPRVWDVHDAGPDRPVAVGPGEPTAWFHVTTRTPGGGPLPVRPFLAACGSALGRLGRFDLNAVQILLPAEGLDPSQRTTLFPRVDGVGWWAASTPAASAEVSIRLDSGRDPSAAEAAPALLAKLNKLDQQIVTADPTSLRQNGPDSREFVFSDHLWPGPPGGGATFNATLAEWNLNTIGWLGSLIGDIAAADRQQRFKAPGSGGGLVSHGGLLRVEVGPTPNGRKVESSGHSPGGPISPPPSLESPL